MQNHNKWPSTYLISMLLWVSGCAYFNTFYNAQQYFRDAENIRITKGGTSVPVSAMDKYGKTIKKCETVLKDYPEWEFLPKEDLKRKTIEIYFDLKLAKRACSKDQKVIKVPNTDVFRIVSPILISRGISMIVSAENLIAL